MNYKPRISTGTFKIVAKKLRCSGEFKLAITRPVRFKHGFKRNRMYVWLKENLSPMLFCDGLTQLNEHSCLIIGFCKCSFLTEGNQLGEHCSEEVMAKIPHPLQRLLQLPVKAAVVKTSRGQ